MSAAGLQFIDVRKRLGRTEVIRGVSLSVASGERHAIIRQRPARRNPPDLADPAAR